MLLFGRSLFGGALAAGFVTLAGVASCTAQAAGEAQVLYNAAGVADGSASVAAGALRTAVAIGDSAQAVASAHAAPLAEFLLSGSAQASAQASGSSLAWYMASGVAQGEAYVSGQLRRRVRMPFQPPAKAYAQGSGEPVSYVLAYGRPAVARASLVGTTYMVGAGVARAYAELFGDGQRLLGEKQVAAAEAWVSAQAVFVVGAAGVAHARATAAADAALTRGGVRYLDFVGSAQAQANAALSQWVVYQPQVMRAYANASVAAAVHIRGFSGVASADARASGYMDMRYTGQVGAPAQIHAYAYGYGVRRVEGEGECTALAQGLASPQMAANLAGEAQAGATLGVSTVEFQLFAVPAQAGAHASGWAERIRIAAGAPATADASATGANQINDLSRAPRTRTLGVAASSRYMLVPREGRQIAVEV